ncbi:MAG: dockerin type I domain-containing protein [Candidatus Bathyarchaeia archaeon]
MNSLEGEGKNVYRKFVICSLIATLSFASIIIGGLNITMGQTTPEYLILNPGPGSWSGAWTAGPPRYKDTSNFIFYSNETSVGNTFFLNVTVKNAELMKGWGIGLIFDHTKLSYAGSRRPPDHVFKPIQDMGWTIVAPPATVEPINETHSIIKWGCTYIMGEPPWSFNGTGVLCQIKFTITRGVNATFPKLKAYFTFDPEWTALYQHPTGTIIPTLGVGTYMYLYPLAPTIPNLTFSPKRIVNPSLSPTSRFNITLQVINIQDLYRWDLKVYYKNNILTAFEAFEGDFLKSYGATMFEAAIQQSYNSTHGEITLSCRLVGAEIGAYGSGDLAIITFEVLDYGDTSIIISNDNLYDSSGIPITHTKESGYFSNVLVAKLSVDPLEIINPALVPCSSFNINVTINDVEDVKTIIFNLTYNRDVLLELQVAIPPVLGQIPTKKLIIDDENGYVWVKLTYPNAISTYTPQILATITFHVEAYGVSPINLTDTSIINSAGGSIAHEAHHGIFVGLIRDIAVMAIEVHPTFAYQGWLVYINITVKNIGNLTETFTVKAKYDGTIINQTSVTNLPPYDETTVTIVWKTKNVAPCRNYTISAEAEPLPFEINLANNLLTNGAVKIKIMGDIDGDGKVTMSDVDIFITAFGTYPSHPRWSSEADLDQNGRISMSDVILLIANFGKKC